MSTTPLICPNCDNKIPTTNINVNRMVAVCHICDHIFQLEPGLDVPPGEKSKRGKNKARPYQQPSNRIKVFDNLETGDLEIHHHHRTLQLIFLTIFTIFWDGFMIMWFGIAYSTNNWTMAAFGSIHALAGFGLTYWLLTSYLNTTRIVISQDDLTVTTAPIYVHAPRRIPLDDVIGASVKRSSWRSNGQHHYEVYADVIQGGRRKIAGSLIEYHDAAFIKQEIERFLGIEDDHYSDEAMRYDR